MYLQPLRSFPCRNINFNREDKYNDIKSNGYDICDTAKELEEFYINEWR